MLTSTPEAATSFDELPFSPELRQAISDLGFIAPTPVQAAVIPLALQSRDVIGQAKTGTGKTAAFLLPILQMLDLEKKEPQALILVPTRELVRQVRDEALKLRGETGATVAAIYGGTEYEKQLKALQNGVQIVVGSPGRVMDLIQRGAFKTHALKTVVLDEADQMLDIGFRPQLERILRRVPTERQTLLLSATMPEPVRVLAERYMRDPLMLNLSTDEISVDTIEQRYVTTDPERKFETLLRLLVREKPRQCLVFCQMKVGVRRLAMELGRRVRGVMGMQGDLPQGQRNRVMQELRDGKIRILVATDVVGRGIDIRDISHVINYDLPEDPEAYVHRIGRTGRMGRDGKAFSLITPDQGYLLTNIERFMNKQVAPDRIEGFISFQPREKKAADAAAAAPAVKLTRDGRRISSQRYRKALGH